jgi:hypothetical protein
MRDNVVPLGEDHVIFVAEGVRDTARRNMRAVLDVAFRLESLRALCSVRVMAIVSFSMMKELSGAAP